MISPLFFGLTENFDVSINEQLRELSVFKYWDKGNQKYIYIFPLSSMKQVTTLINPITFKEIELTKILAHTKQEITEAKILDWKGKSGFEVIEFPNIYQIVSYQKSGPGQKAKKNLAAVAKVRVEHIWKEVFKKIPLDEPKRYSYLAPKICRLFGLKRYFKENGSFMKEKFQGTRMGGDYSKFYYFPIKILEHEGLLKRNGQLLTRIKEEWVQQKTVRLTTENSY